MTAKEYTLLPVKPLPFQLAPLSVERYTPFSVPARMIAPGIMNAWMKLLVSPVVTAVQFVPLSEERKMPPPSVPANTVVPSTYRAFTAVFVNPELTAIQVVPLFEERKTPPRVPAKIYVAPTTRARTLVLASPLLTGFQFEPLSAVIQTPSFSVAARRFVLETAKPLIAPPKGPFVNTH
ncbi:MAG: hypothetical protein HYZ01_00015 [Ignavibacteriales bacterium]|nr:hypothetical protein [Ignavibacteriales bacterium]